MKSMKFPPELFARLWINVYTVAVMRSEYCRETELHVPWIREGGDDVGQWQVQLLLTDWPELWPGEVTAGTSGEDRLWAGQHVIPSMGISMVNFDYIQF